MLNTCAVIALAAMLFPLDLQRSQPIPRPSPVPRPPARAPGPPRPEDGSAAPDGYAPIPEWLGQTRAPRPEKTAAYAVETVAEGLAGAFCFDFLPDGRMISHGLAEQPFGAEADQVGALNQRRLGGGDVAGNITKSAQQIMAIVDYGKSELAF